MGWNASVHSIHAWLTQGRMKMAVERKTFFIVLTMMGAQGEALKRQIDARRNDALVVIWVNTDLLKKVYFVQK